MNGMEDQTGKQDGHTDPAAAAANPAESQHTGKKEKKLRFRKDNKAEELQQEMRDLNDKYLRLFAEFDNFRKRSMKEKTDLLAFAGEELVSALLPVLDDFSRALQSIRESGENNAMTEGILLIHGKLNTILEQNGLSAMDCTGKPFDTDFHEAITSVPASGDMKGKVVDEIQKGYLFKGKVIRFAKVVVGN